MKRIEGFTKVRSCYSIHPPWLKNTRVRRKEPLDSEGEQGDGGEVKQGSKVDRK